MDAWEQFWTERRIKKPEPNFFNVSSGRALLGYWMWYAEYLDQYLTVGNELLITKLMNA